MLQDEHQPCDVVRVVHDARLLDICNEVEDQERGSGGSHFCQRTRFCDEHRSSARDLALCNTSTNWNHASLLRTHR